MTGYQQAILYLSGAYTGDRFCVRNVDRHFVDAVRDCFPKSVSPFLQHRTGDAKKDYWCIKSAQADKPSLSDVSDFSGFCRGFLELQGGIDAPYVRHRNTRRLAIRLRIRGAEDDLKFVARHLPAKPKKMQYISTHTGHTFALYYQSRAEILDILDFIDGFPQNTAVWEKWWETINTTPKPQA